MKKKVLYDVLDGRGFSTRESRDWGVALYKSYLKLKNISND